MTMTSFDAKTQRGRILRLLRWKGGQCGSELLGHAIPRYSARIYELRKEGYQIRRRLCDRTSHHHYSRQWIYELVP